MAKSKTAKSTGKELAPEPARSQPIRAARSVSRGDDGLFPSIYTPPKTRRQQRREQARIEKKVASRKSTKSSSSSASSDGEGEGEADKPKRKTKPTYAVILLRTLKKLQGQHNGHAVSLYAINKFVGDTYPVPDNYKRYISQAIRNGLEEGVVEREGQMTSLTSRGRRRLAKPEKSRKRKRESSSSKDKSKKKSSSSKDKPKKSSSSKSKSKSTSKSRSKSPSSSSKSKSKGKEKASSSKKSSSDKSKKSSSSKSKSKSTSSKSSSKSSKKSTSRKSTKRARTEERGETASSAPKKKTQTQGGHYFKWQYQDGAWKDYAEAASDIVENQYQHYLKNPGQCDVRSVNSGQWSYQVDFLNNRQTNIQHESHTVRNIRRVPLSA